MKYIELNPVRACMVELPGHYRWSSFCHNSGTRRISFIDFHYIYSALGSTSEDRFRAYVELFRYDLSNLDMQHIRDTWQTGTPLGSNYFLKMVEKQLSCKVGKTKRGRPKVA